MGCNFSPVLPSTEKLASKAIENPAFNIPPLNLKDFNSRQWILLAESKENNWFYDPYSLTEDDDNIVSFDAYISPRPMPAVLDRFNASVTGPYRQKIDCFGNHQWSETFYADKMPDQETFKHPQKPSLEYGWIKIKPKSAMAYIRTRICGRKFIDDANVNYFLYQEGLMAKYKAKEQPNAAKRLPLTEGELMVEEYKKLHPPMNSLKESTPSDEVPGLFYEVVSNKVSLIDSRKNIREIRISSYVLDKEFPKIADYVFRANCETKTYSFAVVGKTSTFQELSGSSESLPNVAFDRTCGDHGTYMKLVLPGSR